MWPSRAELLRQLKAEIEKDPFFSETLYAYDSAPEFSDHDPDAYTVCVGEKMLVNVPLFGDTSIIDMYEMPLRAITPAFTIWDLKRLSRAYVGESSAPAYAQAQARVEFEADAKRNEMVEEAVDYIDTLNRISVPVSGGGDW